MAKKDRFTIGQKASNLMLEILTNLVCAYHSKDLVRKRELLTQANTDLECLKILLRLAKDVHVLDKLWYVRYEKQLQEIGKMLGGWIAALSKTNR